MTVPEHGPFIVYRGMSDLGEVCVDAGHVAENGFLDIAIGSVRVRVSITPQESGEGAHALLDLRTNLNHLIGARIRAERDGGEA